MTSEEIREGLEKSIEEMSQLLNDSKGVNQIPVRAGDLKNWRDQMQVVLGYFN